MKIAGWIFTLLGSGGLIGTLVVRDSSRYRLDRLAKDLSDISNDFISRFIGLDNVLGLDDGFYTTVDTLFYISIGVLILGFIFIVTGYRNIADKK